MLMFPIGLIAADNPVDQKKRHARNNRRIRDVKSVPVIVKIMKIEKIDDGSVPEPVNDVSDRAAHDRAKRQGNRKGCRFPQPTSQKKQDHHRDADQNIGHEIRRALVIHEAKGHPFVPHKDEIEKGCNRNRPMHIHHRIENQGFRDLIDNAHKGHRIKADVYMTRNNHEKHTG